MEILIWCARISIPTYPSRYGQAISMHSPRETNLAPDFVGGGCDVTSLNSSFISSSVNLQQIKPLEIDVTQQSPYSV